ncbi:hypothetical protein V6N12_042692 [Hibiscus sabdariffa]|uniref:Uncharacterized protein n=1 Tax=Hibiscus sabdariffa TaxID=183260 RepID=A0ABR2B5M2_9ROSI
MLVVGLWSGWAGDVHDRIVSWKSFGTVRPRYLCWVTRPFKESGRSPPLCVSVVGMENENVDPEPAYYHYGPCPTQFNPFINKQILLFESVPSFQNPKRDEWMRNWNMKVKRLFGKSQLLELLRSHTLSWTGGSCFTWSLVLRWQDMIRLENSKMESNEAKLSLNIILSRIYSSHNLTFAFLAGDSLLNPMDHIQTHYTSSSSHAAAATSFSFHFSSDFSPTTSFDTFCQSPCTPQSS